MKRLIIASFLMCVLGVTAYANDCTDYAVARVNEFENDHGCYNPGGYSQAICDAYADCISH